MSAHTPGPWVKRDGEVLGSNGKRVRFGHSGFALALESNPGAEAMANTAVAMAAPELKQSAELLESLCLWLLHRFGPVSPEGREAEFRLEQARNAIAKAEVR